MIRAVLDTNTIVSGVGWGGPPGAVLDAALAGHFEIVTSPTLLDELRRVLGYPKLRQVIDEADKLIELLALTAIVVTPTETVDLVRDPDDNRLIEAAQAGHANVIVTGDQDLLTLGHIGQIQVLTPREFLDALQPDTWILPPRRRQLRAEAALSAPAHHHRLERVATAGGTHRLGCVGRLPPRAVLRLQGPCRPPGSDAQLTCPRQRCWGQRFNLDAPSRCGEHGVGSHGNAL